MPTYTPATRDKQANAQAQPLIAICYEAIDSRHKTWQPCWAVAVDGEHAAITHLDFTNCLNGGIEFTDASGNDYYDSTTRTLKLPRYGQPKTTTKLWFDRRAVTRFIIGKKEVKRADLKAAGYTVLTKPLEDDDPTAGATHEDFCHTEYCMVCKGYYMDEPSCCHLKWQEGGGGWYLGVGSQDVDYQEAQTSIYALLDLLPHPLVEHWHELLAANRFDLRCGAEWHWNGDAEVQMKASPSANTTFYETLNLPWLETIAGGEQEAEDTYWPGLAWLGSLDHSDGCQPYLAVTQGWIFQYLEQKHPPLRITTGTAPVWQRSDYELVHPAIISAWTSED